MLASLVLSLAADAQSTNEPVHLDQITVYGQQPADTLQLGTDATTGTRLGIPARQLPASLSIIDQQTMRWLGARTTREAVQLAPGVTGAEPPNWPGILSTRGFTGNDVAALYDGLQICASSMSIRPEDTWKYERIEVLKGPASVLYGEGALAGAVNYVPKAPNLREAEYELFSSYGSFNTSRLGLGAGGPLGQSGVAYRFDLSRQSSDGFVDRSGYEYYDLSGALRYDVSDQFSLTFSFDAAWDDIESYWGTPLIYGNVDSRTREVNYNVSDDRTDQNSQWLRLKAEWKPSDAVQVRNLLYGYLADRGWRNVERYTCTPTNNMVRRTSVTEILHDQYMLGDRLDALFVHDIFERENRFLAGVEGNLDDFQRDSNRPESAFDFVDLLNPISRGFDDLRKTPTVAERGTRTLTGAVFVEDRYKVLDWFYLVGGLRGESISVDSDNLRVAPRTGFTKEFTPLTGRIGGVFEVTTNTSLYAQYTTAAKPTSALVVFDEANQNYGLERGEMVEVGLKESLWENRLNWTLALYEINKTDIVTRDPADPSKSLQIGEQSSRGVELGLALQPVNAWTVGGNVALVDAQYETFMTAAAVSYADNTPPNVPGLVANVWTSYRLPWNIELGGIIRWVGEAQADNANTLPLPGYSTLDLSLTYRYKRAEFSVRARNVLDKEYSQWSIGDGAQVLLGEPLAIEGSVYYRF